MLAHALRAVPCSFRLAAVAIVCAGFLAVFAADARADTLLNGGLNGKIAFASDRPFGVEGDEAGERSQHCSTVFNNELTTQGGGVSGAPGDDECAFDIFTMNPDGSDLRNLTDTDELDALDDEPSWSPDGTKIAYVSRQDCADDGDTTDDACTTDIWMMDADGGNKRQLTDACVVVNKGPFDARGRQQCRDPRLHDTHPTWSPDGQTIAFSRGGFRNDTPFTESPNGDGVPGRIYTIPANGSPGDEALLDTGADEADKDEELFESDLLPYWSNDGGSIVFTRFRCEKTFEEFPGPTGLPEELSPCIPFLINAVHDVLSGKQPSPEGLPPVGTVTVGFSVQTYQVDASGGEAQPLGTLDECAFEVNVFPETAGFDLADGCDLDFNPALSADNSRLAIQRLGFESLFFAGNDTDIYTFNRDGSGSPTVLPADEPCRAQPQLRGNGQEPPPDLCPGDFKPAYSPQGDRIVFDSDRIDPRWTDEKKFPFPSQCGPNFTQYGETDCERGIFTIAPDGSGLEGPINHTEQAAPSDAPIVDRNADWQRLQPPQGCTDATAPTVTITPRTGNSPYRVDERATVQVSASDPSGLKEDPSNADLRISTSSAGRKTLTVRAVDNCDNVGTATYNYVVAADPRVAVAGVARGCTSTNFTVRVRIRSATTMRRVTVSLNGRRIASSTRSRFTVRVRARRLRAGRHRLTVTAVDRAGNRTVRRLRFRRCRPLNVFFTG